MTHRGITKGPEWPFSRSSTACIVLLSFPLASDITNFVLPAFLDYTPMTPSPQRRQNTPHGAGLTGPQADPDFAHLAAPEIRHRVRVAHAVHHVRTFSQKAVGLPLGDILLRIWLRHQPGARMIEKKGLPRHNIVSYLGQESLILHIDPRKLIQLATHAPRHEGKRPSSMAFIWDGDWDIRRRDLRVSFWLDYMHELDENRHHLERTKKFQELMAELEAGNPFQSHQEGVYLNSRQRILDYLAVYLGFLDNMAEHGYDRSRAKDNLGVAITRDGRIIKIHRGLHRLAMAQYVGLPEIPVQVQHVHREWWNRITQGVTGDAALQRITRALRDCEPEQEPGPLTPHPRADIPDDFWSALRHDATPQSAQPGLPDPNKK